MGEVLFKPNDLILSKGEFWHPLLTKKLHNLVSFIWANSKKHFAIIAALHSKLFISFKYGRLPIQSRVHGSLRVFLCIIKIILCLVVKQLTRAIFFPIYQVATLSDSCSGPLKQPTFLPAYTHRVKKKKMVQSWFIG